MTPWEKLFQNLRSTRATELSERYPSHVVAAWMGHSVEVGARLYLQVTEDHFANAAKDDAHSDARHAGNGEIWAETLAQRSEKNPHFCGFLASISAPTRTRTLNLMIKSHLLYRLSYRGGLRGTA